MTSDDLRAPDPFAAMPDLDARLSRLRQRLAAEAEREGLLDVAYRSVDSPVGRLLLAATPQGLVRVAYEVEDHDAVLASLSERISPRVLRANGRLDPVAVQLDAYFAGARSRFTLSLDLRLATGFRLSVLEHLRDIPYGSTASYAAVAALAGSPRAVRAVGTACATNPLPVILPCHRVIYSDGRIGRYLGGEQAKQSLLRLEGAL
ncbi:cysteine methyltransferase [Frankia sp. CcI156]|jgi:methylated-DNA-[protein]-cysteine S-methyltransferase|uniref:Methylated-DNA--protein-cysteine methyltransferase n=2 Tax=Frankiaceae TaxID=74712 RepID=Q2JGQ1_FRACC|nr:MULTISPECIES: methylated-DNA--[protein]-cysteine S-methyltransferase [Frankia]ABD09541.1 methylated-DNA--protein-cysteine methyltransferase [Frankia casuarinae]ETA03766.1 methylated DNA-protein cysteine methyltransferase [Frankia sp. CcI6]EYT93566.1 methylated DNA-protein cysteine methyltransferase [Frankia casuarinae]KDA40580.1 methylated DNA-protein cysteine methyltransferase [Frankia sp. BMG5.23]KEZ37254.1 O-6-methylguanine DNA methyltransferase [Frankia sp. CeD]